MLPEFTEGPLAAAELGLYHPPLSIVTSDSSGMRKKTASGVFASLSS